MNLLRPQSGQILYRGIDICDRRAFRANRRTLQAERQIIFQDSGSSLNGRMRVCDIIAEPMRIQHVRPPRGSYRAEAEFQIAFLIQKSDEILDAAEAALVEITVEGQLETVGDCVK